MSGTGLCLYTVVRYIETCAYKNKYKGDIGMKKGHDLKIREKLSKSYMHVIFIASISAIVGIGALLIMTRMYNKRLPIWILPGRYREGDDSVRRCEE